MPALLREGGGMWRGAYTDQGGKGYVRDPRSELFVLAVALFAGEETSAETAAAREHRYTLLVRRLAVEDPEWTAGLLAWLRGSAHMRRASLVGAAAYVKARLDAGATAGPSNRGVVDSVLQRADEPGALLAHWTATYGRALPKPLKRGVADAVRRLYHGRSLLKYDTAAHEFRFGDVLNLTHAAPDPAKPWQGDLFRYALDRRHRPARAVPPASVPVLGAHRELMELPVAERRPVVTGAGGAERLARAGLTWEALAGWLQGPLDAAVWEAMIPSMGPMALVRNLRNFDGAGVSDEVAARVAERIADPEVVAASRQFPFRYLAAHRHAPSARWAEPLERALGHSLANVPALPGRTLVLVDRSGSMWEPLSERSQLNRADAAAVFGTALALRAEAADLVQFGSYSHRVRYEPGEGVLRILERFRELGGTETVAAVLKHYDRHDRVLIITDEQAAPHRRLGHPASRIPSRVPVYTWNLGGHRIGHVPADLPTRHTFGGLGDAAFRMVPLLEAGLRGAWPWLADDRAGRSAGDQA
ncbi:TROVE domain-containing protein [Streptomyces sp. NPDC101132]|uniref:TROVE domain-containing protein n=1 Tax=Streptomyces sp. NPDC101132 TaxID=3366110 RepID=UPI003826BAF0